MVKEPKVFILDIESKYNTDLLPVVINDSEIIDIPFKNFGENRCLRSQYSLEIHLNEFFGKHKSKTINYNDAEIVFLPIYLFLSAWKEKYFYNVNDVIKHLNELVPLINQILWDGKKVVMVYSDVMWEDERCFINHFKFNDNVYFICYEDAHESKNLIPVPYITHIKCDPKDYTVPFIPNKKYLISYAGRERKEVKYFDEINFLNTNTIKTNHWITKNDEGLYNQIDDLYLNSYFSLHPHGDRKSRKGFYHSILLGCIPVVFENNFEIYQKVFKDIFDIEEICVIIKDVKKSKETLMNKLVGIEKQVSKINQVKNLLLYHDNDLSIVDYLISKISSNP